MKREAPAHSGASTATVNDSSAVGWHRATPALRARRQELGLRLADVATATSLGLSRIAKVEKGEHLAPAASAALLAATLQAEIDELFEPRMLLSSEAQRVKGLGDVHTVTRSIDRGELAIAKPHSKYVYLWAHEVEAWQPRRPGGQRRLEPIVCDRDGCPIVFQPHDAKDRLCSTECRDLDRQQFESLIVSSIKQACELLDSDDVARQCKVSRGFILELVWRRELLPAWRVDAVAGRPRLLFAPADVAALRRWLLDRVHAGGGPPEHLIKAWRPQLQKRWRGKMAPPPPTRISAERRHWVLNLRAEGSPMRAIADTVGVSVGTVANVISEAQETPA